MTISRSGELLSVVTPSRRTSSGSRGSAMATRFCTSTCALSRSVPSLNVIVSVIAPSVVHLRRHVEHVFDAVDLLLDRRGDRLGDHLGRRAGIARADDDRRRHDVGILRRRQREVRDARRGSR